MGTVMLTKAFAWSHTRRDGVWIARGQEAARYSWLKIKLVQQKSRRVKSVRIQLSIYHCERIIDRQWITPIWGKMKSLLMQTTHIWEPDWQISKSNPYLFDFCFSILLFHPLLQFRENVSPVEIILFKTHYFGCVFEQCCEDFEIEF